MAFAYTILYVPDVAGTLRFYEEAFGLTRRFLDDSGQYGELETGATTLSFSALALMHALGKNPSAPDPSAPCFEIAFTVPDVPVAVARAVTAGAELAQAPKEMPWGQTTAYVRDPNGFLVELCTPVMPVAG